MISITIPDLAGVLKQLPNEDKARSVLSRALNRSATAGREASRKKVSEEYTIKAGKFRKTAKITKATRANLEARITWKSEMTNLANFQITPKKATKRRPKKQLVASVRRGKPVVYKGTFIGPNDRVYRRNGKFKIVNGVKKERISAVFGTSATHLARGDAPREAAQKAALATLLARVDHEIARMLK